MTTSTQDLPILPLGNTPIEVAAFVRDLQREARNRLESLAAQIAAGERPILEVVGPVLAAAGASMSDLEACVARHVQHSNGGD